MTEAKAQYESPNTSDDILADAYAVATDQPTMLTITTRHRREVKLLMRLLHVYMEEFRKLERKNERLERELAKKK